MTRRYRSTELSGGEVVGCCLLVIVGLIAYTLAFAWVFQTLWNFVVPSVFGGPYLEYNQALAITVLLSLIGSFFKSTSTDTKS